MAERYKFHADGAVFYLTFSVVEWLPIFVAEKSFKIVTESLNYCHQCKGLRINAYVIMPTHIHLICFHESFDARKLEVVIGDLRKFTGRQLCDWCSQHSPTSFSEVFRRHATDNRERRFWQPTRHPNQLTSESMWQVKLNYLHANPIRKGLVHDALHWRFSSASHWLSDRPTSNDVMLTTIDW